MQKGFSLVELSIVLVILGLLTGGILAGQNLIRAAELRAVTTEYDRYVSAVNTFRDKYFALPGDFRDATKFWGRASTNANCVTNSSQAVASPGACDGDGDGDIEASTWQMFGFWRHLANAGLIEGSYTGEAGSGSVLHSVPSENAPRSKLSNGVWAVQNQPPWSGNGSYFDGDYGNYLQLGTASTTSDPNVDLLVPEEMWNIDTKMDDGKPATGTVRPRVRVGCAVQANGAALTTSAAHAALTDAEYNLTSSAVDCAMVFKQSF